MNLNTNLIVKQSNDLVTALYKLKTIGEARLIRLLIAQIKKSDEDFKTYRIDVSDFAKVFNLRGRSAYELIDKAAEGLAHCPITVRVNKSWVHLNWLSSAKYIEGSGCVELRFDSDLKPLLLNIQERFTMYGIENIASFKSDYSIRLYELLKMEQFKSKKGGFQKIFEYNELRDILSIDENTHKLFADFRIYVIDQAMKEINLTSDICIKKVDYNKTPGERKYTHITFFCEKARQTRLNIDEPEMYLIEVPIEEKKEHPDDVKQLITFGIAEETAYTWRKKYGVARIIRNLGYVTAKKNSGKVKEDLAGYVTSAIAKDYGKGWEIEQQAKEKARKEIQITETKQEENLKKSAIELNEERAQRKALLDEFHALPELEQEGIRRVYETQANNTILFSWNKSKKSNPKNPENGISVLIDFISFYTTYRANLQLPL